MQVNAIAAVGPDAPLERTTIERRDVGEHEVLIAITFAGICHSDIHTVRAEWGHVTYPIVVGHEIAGVVQEVGAGVTRYRVGDHVGVGCFVDSCRECDNCVRGLDNYCTKGMIGTYDAIGRDGLPTAGGYSTHIVVDENYVLRIPTTCRSTPPRRCCAPASRRSPRCGTGASARTARWRSSASAGSGTWPSSSRTRWAPTSRCSRSR